MVDLIEKLEEAAQWDDSPSQFIHEAIAHIGERDAEVKRLEAKVKGQTSAGFCDAQYLSDGPPYRCGWQQRAEAAEARLKEMEEALAYAEKGLDMIHNGLMDPTRPRQSVGEVCAHFLSAARTALKGRLQWLG